MENRLLNEIDSPADLKALPFDSLPQLCEEIRELLVSTTAKTGGHLSSNLGTVELTVAIHRVFDSPEDQIVWDVGHQCYTHKLLTGRRENFSTLRQENGISGFPKHQESEHDAFISGHSSTSISVAYGLARGKQLQNDPHHVIAVIGDGAFTSGLAYEGANNAGRCGDNLIVILNDNKMSISKNVGGLAKHLSKIRARPAYFRTKDRVESALNKMPLVGKSLNKVLMKIKSTAKTMVYGSNWFEDLGFTYLGPVDGHNLRTICDVLQRAKDIHRPVFLHVETKKGKGYSFAEENPGEYHGTSGFDIETGRLRKEGGSNFSNQFGIFLTELGGKDKRICAITAAMKYGTGLNYFSHAFKQEGRFFDVGIAEPHAVTFAGGLAAKGMLPVFAVYSSFIQRCYDEILHDLSIEKQHVLLAVDRAGIVGSDGETHQGIFDVALLSGIPGITIYSPSTYKELFWATEQSLYTHDGVCCVRYPRGGEFSLKLAKQGSKDKENPDDCANIYADKDFTFTGISKNNLIITYGRLAQEACRAIDILKASGIQVSLLKINRIVPLPEEAISIAAEAKHILFAEEGAKAGGIAQALGCLLLEKGYKGSYSISAIEDFVPQASVESALTKCQLDAESLANRFAMIV